MDAEQLAKIDAALSLCLDHCKRAARPYTWLSQYLEPLQSNGGWTEAEIIELQTRVIRVLLHEQRNRPNTPEL